MPINIRVQLENDLFTLFCVFTTFKFAIQQMLNHLLLFVTQRAVSMIDVSTMATNSTISLENIPFENYLCSVASTEHCVDDPLLTSIRATPLILFLLLVYFIRNHVTLDGDHIHIFVYTFRTIFFICFLVILLIVYQIIPYYHTIGLILAIMSLLQCAIYFFSV